MRIQRTRSIWGSALMAALAVVIAIIASGDTAHAAFNPTATASVADPTPNATSDITTTFSIDAPDPNFAALITFLPPEWGVATDAEVPNGALAAQLTAQATLGLINGPCYTKLQPSFDMLDATTDTSNVLPDAYGESAGRNGGPEDDQYDIVGGLPLGVTKYPDYLTRILVAGDPDVPGQPALQPRARMYGQTEISGVDVSLNFIIFEPATTIQETELDPALGYPSVTILQALGDPEAEPSPIAITDFCTPLASTTTTFGVTKNGPTGSGGGVPYRTNPGDGTYLSIAFAAGQRDADGDGWENSMDPCPLDPDPGWDPRLLSPAMPDPTVDDDPDPFGAPNGDGIPRSCDPDPNNATGNSDHDFDGYQNRQDNCPLVANSKGIPYAGAAGPDNQKDSDNDGIGDACDPNPNVEDGEQTILCMTGELTVGAGGTAPPAPDICTEDAIGFTGGDGDGPGATPTPTPAPAPTEKASGILEAGETVTTDEEGDGATADDPVETTLTSPNAGEWSIEETDVITVTPPQGFQFLGQQVEITAPDATPDDPLVIVFQLDSSIIPAGENENSIQVFKDGVLVAACSDASGTASPDPCVSDRELLGDGDVQITVLTSTASSWNFGVATGDAGTDAAGGAATGVGSLAPVASSIPAWAAIISALGGAGLLGSLGAIASRIIRRRQ